MYNHILLTIIAFFSFWNSSYAGEGFRNPKLYYGASYSINKSYNGKIFYSYDSFETGKAVNYEVNWFSFSTITEREGKRRTLFSSNPIFTIVMLPLANTKYSLLPLLPQIAGNFKIQYHIVPNRLFFTIGQNTDYYLFINPSKIHTESTAGFAVIGGLFSGPHRYRRPVKLSASVNKPWTKSYLGNRSIYVNIGISLLYGELGN
ncbi:MAG: hypothetical protein Q7W05_14580 [Deltaproteobacteria bacterium]|nr:hypothetical protein [Deltaproteobacteria bacterium]